jgi:aminopeptidase N
MPFGPVEIKINYIANPERELVDVESNAGSAILAEKGIYFINHDLRNPAIPRQLWSQGETHGSRCWFPTIDQPNQKHTQRITLTYPDTMVSISNGERLSHTKIEKTKEYKSFVFAILLYFFVHFVFFVVISTPASSLQL